MEALGTRPASFSRHIPRGVLGGKVPASTTYGRAHGEETNLGRWKEKSVDRVDIM